MPLNLSEAFDLVPGIYVIGPRDPKNGGSSFWKVGMGTSLRSRLADYQICFPEGFYMRLLLSLPTPEGKWREVKIRRAVRFLEARIHQELKGSDQVEHVSIVHSRSEWFRGRFADIQAIIIDVLTDLGLQDYVRVHADLSAAKYGPSSGGKGRARIPKGDSAQGVRDAPDLEEYVGDLSGREKTAVEALMDLSQPKRPELNSRLAALDIPANPSEEREYTVQKLVGDRIRGGRRQFKVRWRGYKENDDTWEDRETLMENAAYRVEQYENEEAARQMVSMQKGRGYSVPQAGGELGELEREELEVEVQQLRATIAQATPEQRPAAIADLKERIKESEHRIKVYRWSSKVNNDRMQAVAVALTDSESEMDTDESDGDEDYEAEYRRAVHWLEYYTERAPLLAGLLAEVRPQEY